LWLSAEQDKGIDLKFHVYLENPNDNNMLIIYLRITTTVSSKRETTYVSEDYLMVMSVKEEMHKHRGSSETP
jgi:hypothetical protein